jgi:hypothetical protein
MQGMQGMFMPMRENLSETKKEKRSETFPAFPAPRPGTAPAGCRHNRKKAMRWRCGDCKRSLYRHRIAPMLHDDVWQAVAAHDVGRRLCDACLRHRMRRVLGRELRFEDITACRFNIENGHHQELTSPGKLRLAYEDDVLSALVRRR